MKFFVFLSLLITGCAFAQEDAPEPATTTAPPACSSEKHRQFDFWVGEWNVTQNGEPAGHNLIKLVHGDCALNENWTSAAGNFSGASFNIYDQANDKWHQTWVDTTGTLLELDGGLVDGKMVLSGERPGADGAPVTNRITFTPNEDGSVLQTWDVSSDGESWNTVFNGLYVRAEGTE
jgi:hypothetical protein